MDAQELYTRLGRLLEEAPTFEEGRQSMGAREWLAKANALVAAAGDIPDSVRFRTIAGFISQGESDYGHEAVDIVMRALAIAELKAPASSQGAFIGTGKAFDAMAAVGKVLADAKTTIRIVDPYMDEKALTDFAPLANEGVAIQLLTDEATVKGTLFPAVGRFAKQYDTKRPIDARVAPPRTLHDRLIVLDDSVVWSLTQSLKDMAERSPASIVRIDGDAAKLKIAAYDDFWKNAKPLT